MSVKSGRLAVTNHKEKHKGEKEGMTFLAHNACLKYLFLSDF